MKVNAISMNDLIDKTDNVYSAVNILAKRARQIADLRAVNLDLLEDIEDSEQLREFEEKIDLDQEKEIVQALEELFDEKYSWSYIEEQKK
tara:strand:+ start:109 stop:378 length:270 start_codon:yes stop_codon:yes gene_type:complete